MSIYVIFQRTHYSWQIAKTDGTVCLLIKTIAFGKGNDCKGLNSNIYYGPSSNLEDLLDQESERVGHDGTPSPTLVLVVYPCCTGSWKLSQEVKQYCANTAQCRHKIFLAIFDRKVQSSFYS